MVKFFLRFFFLLLIITTSSIIYLSYFGFKTDKFDGFIKSKANKVNQYVKLEFQNTKIHLNPAQLNFIVKLQNPKILIKNSNENADIKLQGMLLLTVLVGFTVHSMTYDSLRYPHLN